MQLLQEMSIEQQNVFKIWLESFGDASPPLQSKELLRHFSSISGGGGAAPVPRFRLQQLLRLPRDRFPTQSHQDFDK